MSAEVTFRSMIGNGFMRFVEQLLLSVRVWEEICQAREMDVHDPS